MGKWLTILGLVLALNLFGTTGAAAADELAQTPGQVCFHNCIEQNGTDAKASCAMQCGVVGRPGAAGAGQGQRDCGTLYKTCMQGCSSDKACQRRCREARKQCI